MEIRSPDTDRIPLLLHGKLGLQLKEDDVRAIADCEKGAQVCGALQRSVIPKLNENERAVLEGWLKVKSAKWGVLIKQAKDWLDSQA